MRKNDTYAIANPRSSTGLTAALTMAAAIILVAAAVVSSCASTRGEPTGPEATLVVGQYEINFNTPEFTGTPDGFDDGSVRSFLQRYGSSRSVEFRVRSEESGNMTTLYRVPGTTMVVGRSLRAGTYRLFELRITASDPNRGTGTVRITMRSPLVFDVRSGFVNNLGEIVMGFEGDEDVSIDWKPRFDVVETTFGEEYPESAWNNFPWLEVGLAYE